MTKGGICPKNTP